MDGGKRERKEGGRKENVNAKRSPERQQLKSLRVSETMTSSSNQEPNVSLSLNEMESIQYGIGWNGRGDPSRDPF